MQGIEIPIGAPLGQLDKNLKGAESKLKGFAAEASKSAAALGGSVTSGAKSAGFALQNLGRVAQDAPFGFIGIQNNIQPLLESFQRLKQESGSTGGALKALTSSLVGGGGLLLAVSLVTSALTVLAQNPEKVAGALNYLSGVVDNATATQKEYNQALIETQAEAKLEISTLESLIGIAKNENLSRNARLEALKAVKAEYPEQLNFLTLETVGSKEAANAINLLSDSLLRKAKIQAAEKLLGEAFVKQLEATTKSAVEQASTFSKVVGVALGAAGIKNFVVLQDGLNNQTKAFKEAGSEIDTYNKILNNLRTEEAKTGNLFDDKKVKEKNKKLSDAEKAEIEFQKRLAQIRVEAGKFNANLIIGGIKRNADAEIAAYEKYFEGLDKVLNEQDPLDKYFKKRDKANVQSLLSPFENFKLVLQSQILPQIGTSFKTFFDNILMQGKFSFDSLGQAIAALGQAIKNTFLSVLANEATQGVLNLLGQKGGKEDKKSATPLISGIASLLGIVKKVAAPSAVAAVAAPVAVAGTTAAVAAGTTAVSAGTAAALAPAAASPLLPIIAGIAAVALIANLFKKKKQAPIPQASSTISTSAAGSAQDFGGGRVVFEISGTNLVGVLNRAGAKLQRFGP